MAKIPIFTNIACSSQVPKKYHFSSSTVSMRSLVLPIYTESPCDDWSESVSWIILRGADSFDKLVRCWNNYYISIPFSQFPYQDPQSPVQQWYTTSAGADTASLLSSTINSLHNWIQEKYLQFNASKCKYMLISRKRQPLVSSDLFTINNLKIEKVEHFKYLGVWLSSNLTWNKHIEEICKSASKQTVIVNFIKIHQGRHC